MKLKTFGQYITEKQLSSIKAGDDSEVVVSDQKTADGKIISAQEILGQIIASETEDEFKGYFYDKYGSTKFDTATMGQMVTAFNKYYQEVAAADKEEEKDGGKKEEGGAEGGEEGGGEEEDPLAGLGI